MRTGCGGGFLSLGGFVIVILTGSNGWGGGGIKKVIVAVEVGLD